MLLQMPNLLPLKFKSMAADINKAMEFLRSFWKKLQEDHRKSYHHNTPKHIRNVSNASVFSVKVAYPSCPVVSVSTSSSYTGGFNYATELPSPLPFCSPYPSSVRLQNNLSPHIITQPLNPWHLDAVSVDWSMTMPESQHNGLLFKTFRGSLGMILIPRETQHQQHPDALVCIDTNKIFSTVLL
jgi:hypothetical protein